jgi:hypothetical protein
MIVTGQIDAMNAITAPHVSNRWQLNGVAFTSEDHAYAGGYDYTNNTGVILSYSENTWILDFRPDFHIKGIKHF